jgi:hypothetical protein
LSLIAAFSAAAVCAGYATGCSSSPSGDTAKLPEHLGGVIMRLSSVPTDVQCVEIDTSDYRTNQVRVDVTPGQSATITLAPLNPGEVYLWGNAYNQPCATLGYGSFDGGYVPPTSDVTWVADSTPVFIVSGQYTNADLHFHQLGGANVTIDWDTCDGGGGNFYYCGGGPDAGPDVDVPDVQFAPDVNTCVFDPYSGCYFCNEAYDAGAP